MVHEFVLTCLLLTAAILLLLWRPGRRGLVTAAAFAAVGALGVLGATLAWKPMPPRERDISHRPVEVEQDGYISDQTCRACHPNEHDAWHASYHRTMTQVASPTSIVGTFDGTVMKHKHRDIRLEREGDTFWMTSTGAAGDRKRRRIVLATGSHHMQIYWHETPSARTLDQVPFAYLIREQRWIPMAATFLHPPNAPQTSEKGKWNFVCIRCHATHGRPRYNPRDQTSQTLVAQFGISCQACHGPADEHVRVNRSPWRRYLYHLALDDDDETVVQPGHLEARPSSQVCGQCHSVYGLADLKADQAWNQEGYAYRPGQELTDSRDVYRHGMPRPTDGKARPFWPSEDSPFWANHFWSDGMIRVSGREYSGMIESPCFTHGDEARVMSCLSCHVMHKPPEDERPMHTWANDQLAAHMESDLACVQCHRGFESAERIAAHSRHEAESTGSRCYNCHMPHTTFGLLKAIRSHQVDSPSVTASVQTGRPNACNQCHLDRTLAWTSQHLKAWYDIDTPALDEPQRTVAASVLWALSGDAGQRSLAAWTLGWKPAQEASRNDWIAPVLAQLLEDPYDAVRFIAQRSLRTLPAFADLDYDFVASPEHRAEARRRVMEIWSQATAFPNEAVLIDQEGRLQADRFKQLLLQRDDREITLLE